MSKIVKKKDLDVLIESTLKKAGIKPIKTVKTIKEGNVNDYYLSSGNTNKWFDRNDNSYDMQGDNWDEESYDNFEDWSNSPYGQDADYKGTFNPRVRDSEQWFNRYRDANGPVRVRRARKVEPTQNDDSSEDNMMNQNRLGESTKSNKSLINEELERFKKLSNFKH